MAANVLNSKEAVKMSVFVVRAFVKLRETLAGHKELAVKLTERIGVVKKAEIGSCASPLRHLLCD